MKKLFLLLVFLTLSFNTFSKNITIHIPYIKNGRIKVDGKIEEGVYKKAFFWDKFVQTMPGNNIKPSQKTEMYIFHNGEALIIGIKCYDTHPEKIKRIRRRRDNVWSDVDSVCLAINPFGDGKQYYVFAVSNMNDVSDSLLDFVNGGRQDIDIEFEHASYFFDKGWSVEIVIPFSSITLKTDKNGNSKWYFNVQRYIPRDFQEVINCVPHDRDSNDITNGDMIATLDHIKKLKKKKLKLIPEVVASYSKTKENWGKKEGHSYEKMSIGLTGEYDISSNTVAKFTIHPDFSQVEADDVYQEINNRYPVYFKEKRPFFMDGMESFSSPSPIQLVYTRNIVKPEYGLKFTTKHKHIGFSVISAMEKDVPAERFNLTGGSRDVYWNVLRGTYTFSPGNYIGGFYILRNFGSYFNQVVSIDGANEIGRWNFSYQAVATSLKGENSTKHGKAGDLSVSYKWNRYFSTGVEYNFLSPEYFNDMGFVWRNDEKSYRILQNFFYQPESDKSFVKSFGIGAFYKTEDYYNSNFLANVFSTWFSTNLTHRLQLYMSFNSVNENYKDTTFPKHSRFFYISWAQFNKFKPAFGIGKGSAILYGDNPKLVDNTHYDLSITSEFTNFRFSVDFFVYNYSDRQTGEFIRKQKALQFNGTYFFTDRLSLKTMYQSSLPKYRDYGFKMPHHYFYLLITWQKDAFRKIYAGITNSTSTMNGLDNNFIGSDNDKVAFVKLSWLF